MTHNDHRAPFRARAPSAVPTLVASGSLPQRAELAEQRLGCVLAKKHASSFRVLVIIGVVAAFCAAFLPHMTKPSVASKQTEANHPVACPLQWLPVILAANTPVATTNGRRLLDNVFATKADLRTALVAWDSNPGAAEGTYGPIADFDVSGITDMSRLFYKLENINEDISSWNTSSVTTMARMFQVRALALNLQPSPSLRAACTSTPRPPLSRLAVHSSPYFMCRPCDSAGRGGVQPAAEPRHVQRHRHGLHVSGREEVQPAAGLRHRGEVQPAAEPRHVQRHRHGLHVSGRGGVQPAAELRHVQRHNHERHVL
eukprot:scaffold58689_cov63-Phaeocystis_antarctica.AAC.1